MNCKRAQKLLSRQLDGLLTDRQMAAVTAHLADCPPCRQRREGFHVLDAQIPELRDRGIVPQREEQS